MRCGKHETAARMASTVKMVFDLGGLPYDLFLFKRECFWEKAWLIAL